MTMCNFYEILIDIITFNPMKTGPPKTSRMNLKSGDDFDVGEKKKIF